MKLPFAGQNIVEEAHGEDATVTTANRRVFGEVYGPFFARAVSAKKRQANRVQLKNTCSYMYFVHLKIDEYSSQ